MAIKKSQLYSTLWESCNALRGSMDASQYKDYVLMILFVKYLSDKVERGGSRLKIPEGCTFNDFVALKQNKDIGELINKKLERIREENARLIGSMSLPNFNDPTKLGEGKTMVDTLSKLIGVFQDGGLDFSQNRAADDDLLGDAYEYLMKNFAAESGKSKGQFYTPAEVSRLMALLLHLEGFRKQDSIYDMTGGSGSLLLRALAQTATGRASLFMQEKDNTTASLAMLNMLLHGVELADIRVGDTLNDPKFIEGGCLMTFDACVANPPFSVKDWLGSGSPEKDPFGRWSEELLPPTKCGDFAFLKHLIASMKEDTGRGACILPHGVLFRGNAEYEIRKDLVEKKLIKGIIGLPANVFFGTGIPASIIIVDKAGRAEREGIFFIDAKDGYMKDGNKNRLREQDIRRVVDVWDAMVDVPHYAKLATWQEIKDNDYNLNIPRYVAAVDKEIKQDIEAHLKGGLPKHDIEQMETYWTACPTLKDSLFRPVRDGYYELVADDVRMAVNGDESFRKQAAFFESSLNEWKDSVRDEMLHVGVGCKPKQLIAAWSQRLLDIAKADKSLVDAYSVYDNLMNYWAEAMQDDCYMISNDGWKVELVRPGKNSYSYKDLSCDLLPVPLVVDAYYKNDAAALDEALQKVEEKAAEIETHLEENAEHYELLEKVNESAVKKAVKQFAGSNSVAVWKVYLKLCEEKKALGKKAGEMTDALTEKVVAKYAALSEAEIKQLVVNNKWLATVEKRCQDEMQRVTQELTASVTALAERYERTLGAMTMSVSDYESKVNKHLKAMGFEL